jgi:hypothetical protein
MKLKKTKCLEELDHFSSIADDYNVPDQFIPTLLPWLDPSMVQEYYR